EQWQVSVRKEFVKYGRDRGSPYPAMSWRRPMQWGVSEIAPDLRMPFRLWIPTRELRPPVPGWRAAHLVRWLEPPPMNCVYEIGFYLTKKLLIIHSPDSTLLALWQRPRIEGWELVVLAKALLLSDQEQQSMDLLRQHGLMAAE